MENETKTGSSVTLWEMPREIEKLTKPLKERGFTGANALWFDNNKHKYIKIVDEETNTEYDAVLLYADAEDKHVYHTVAYGWVGGYKAEKPIIVLKIYNGDGWILASYRVIDYEKAVQAGIVRNAV